MLSVRYARKCDAVSLIFDIEMIFCEQVLTEMQLVRKPSAEKTTRYDKDQSKHGKADNCRVETEIRYSHLGDDREYGREYKNRQRVASQIMQKSSYATADIIVYK